MLQLLETGVNFLGLLHENVPLFVLDVEYSKREYMDVKALYIQPQTHSFKTDDFLPSIMSKNSL